MHNCGGHLGRHLEFHSNSTLLERHHLKTSHFTQNRSFLRRSSQPISWLGTENTKTNNTKSEWSELTQKDTNILTKRLKHTKTNLTLTKHKFKNCSYLCAYRCAQLSYTTQHWAVLIIFPLYLQTTTVAQMLKWHKDQPDWNWSFQNEHMLNAAFLLDHITMHSTRCIRL